ncbi:uncharacterized protein VTP21DRAFT_1108, partial [Calcarisporiella thermophila]|uniref:uncharacterized protein n=1 Tax=Calcarisporiella thermophila TaxID=911321 RepID=UPI003742470D
MAESSGLLDEDRNIDGDDAYESEAVDEDPNLSLVEKEFVLEFEEKNNFDIQVSIRPFIVHRNVEKTSIADFALVPPPLDLKNKGSTGPLNESVLAQQTSHSPIGLEQWLELAASKPPAERLQFIVSGCHQQTVLPISFEASSMKYTQRELESTIDVDSVMWTGPKLPLSGNFKYYPFPNRFATLNIDNHLSVECLNSQGKLERMKLFTIPNFEIGTCGQSACIRVMIFFPGLRRKKGRRWINYVKSSEMEQFYDELMLPILKQILPQNDASQFPAFYRVAQELSKAPRGHFHYRSKWIHHHYLSEIFSQLRQKCETDEKFSAFKGFFFHFYGKDLKLVHRSSVGDPLSLLQEQIPEIDWAAIEKGSLFVDIGVEIFPRQNQKGWWTLLWRTEALKEIFKRSGICKGLVDQWCYSAEIAGMRGEARKAVQEKVGLVFMQAYMGEEQGLYTFDSSTGPKKFTAQDVLENSALLRRSIELMREVWGEARSMHHGVRIEYRIDMHNAAEFISSIPTKLEAFIQARPFIMLAQNHVYQFKMYRLEAMTMLTSQLMEFPPKLRNILPRKRLGAYISHLIKSLISRPEDTSWFRDLADQLGIEKSVTLYNAPFTGRVDLTLAQIQFESGESKIDKLLRFKVKGHSRVQEPRQPKQTHDLKWLSEMDPSPCNSVETVNPTTTMATLGMEDPTNPPSAEKQERRLLVEEK